MNDKRRCENGGVGTKPTCNEFSKTHRVLCLQDVNLFVSVNLASSRHNVSYRSCCPFPRLQWRNQGTLITQILSRSHSKTFPYSPLKSSKSDDASKTRQSIIEILSLLWQTWPLFIGIFIGTFCKHKYSWVLWSWPWRSLTIFSYSEKPAGIYYTCWHRDWSTAWKTMSWLLVLLCNRRLVSHQENMVSCFAFILISMVFVSWFWFGFQSHLYKVLYSSLWSTILCWGRFMSTICRWRSECARDEVLSRISVWLSAVWATLIGLTVEYQLREHCENTFEDGACFTRSSTAWDPFASCLPLALAKKWKQL